MTILNPADREPERAWTGDKFIKLPEVIARVGLSRATIYKYIKAGQFPPPISFGGRVSLWSEQRLFEWMERCKS